MSLIKRHDLLNKNVIQKQDTLKFIESINDYEYVENIFFNENDALSMNSQYFKWFYLFHRSNL